MRGRKVDNGRFVKCYDNKLTKKYLEKEYPKQGAYKIAKSLGIHVKTVYNYLGYYKIPRTRQENNKIKKGQIFGLLTLVEPVGKLKNGTITWKCMCDCGSETIVPSSRIKIGKVKSCGCLNKISGSKRWNWKGYCGISGSRFCEIRLRAKKKKWDFNLTPKFLWELFQQQNKRCAITNEIIDLNIDGSLDRIDSSKGYVKNNVWWVKKDINKMKLDFPLNLFIELCEKVVANKENIRNGR
jgi:hypothetical protein